MAKFKLEEIAQNSWQVYDEHGVLVGSAARRATGYLVMLTDTETVVKRYRFIDALKDVFGQDSAFEGMPSRD